MKKPDAAHLEAARRLLACEGESSGTAQDGAEAAVRVYEKLHRLLDPVLGAAGVGALLARSARLAQGEFPALAGAGVVDSAARLRACLEGHESGVATATALFGAFLALLTAFLGDRLTTEVLRRVWPMIEENILRETKK